MRNLTTFTLKRLLMLRNTQFPIECFGVRCSRIVITCLFLIKCTLLPSTLAASESLSSPWLYFGAGAFTYPVNSLAGNTNGSKKWITKWYPILSLDARLEIWGKLLFIPGIHYAFLGHESSSESAKVTTIKLPLGFSYPLWLFDFQFGPGVLWTIIQGAGGTVTLNNGNSTATFAKPGLAAISRLFTWELGLGAQLWRFRLDFDGFVTSALSSDSRELGVEGRLSYGFF